MGRSMNVVNVDKLVAKFTQMAENGRLLTGNRVTQEDILVQILGTIYKVANDEKTAKKKAKEAAAENNNTN